MTTHTLCKSAIFILFLFLPLFSGTPSAAEKAPPVAGIEVALLNDTPLQVILVEYTLSGGSFLSQPPSELSPDGTGLVRYAVTEGTQNPPEFDLVYLIEGNGTFFEINFDFAGDSTTTIGNPNYTTQLRGLARDSYAILTEPAFDPSKRFQTLKTSFSSRLRQEKYGITVNVVNATNFTFTLAATHLEWGKWTDTPVTTISRGETATITARGRDSSWSGAEGFFAYTIDDSNMPQVKVDFDAPFSGDGAYVVTASGPGASNYNYDSTDFDPTEDFNTVTLTISPKNR